MTKQELIENYTVGQLTDKVIELESIIDNKLGGWSDRGISFKELLETQDAKDKVCVLESELAETKQKLADSERRTFMPDYAKENAWLKSEIDKFKKKLYESETKKESETAELRAKVKELEEKTIADFLPTEPIVVAEMLISAKIGRDAVLPFVGGLSVFCTDDLRQIAEHLLAHCNYNEETDDE